ncbi:MAG: hypothetical protein KBG15_21445 [Kofleriaceae bacterium]|nr:hypothetical protein [Kofleriaceae bacterium]
MSPPCAWPLERGAPSVIWPGWERDSLPLRRRFFASAHASAFEVEAVLDISRCSGVDSVNDRAASILAGRVAAMPTALVRGR